MPYIKPQIALSIEILGIQSLNDLMAESLNDPAYISALDFTSFVLSPLFSIPDRSRISGALESLLSSQSI